MAKNSLILALLLAFLLASCSHFQRMDDAVRIKPSKSLKYNNMYDADSNFIALRNGNTLRGTVVKVLKKTYPDSCGSDSPTYSSKYFVVFLDSLSPSPEMTEQIPIEDIELMGPKVLQTQNDYGNINYFENYNEPMDIQALREVAVDSVFIDSCSISCGCDPIGAPGLPEVKLSCPDCGYSWWYIDLKGGYAIYDDKDANGLPVGKDGYFGDITLGWRTPNKHWIFGVLMSSGVQLSNSFKDEDFYRPYATLFGRYTFEKTNCIYPFVYGIFGLTIDKLSVDLFKVSTCEECKSELSVTPPDADISIPLTYGLGVGIDVPLPLCVFDLSFDLGWRSVAFGESLIASGFSNVPSNRRVNMFIFRMGVSFGH